MGGACVSNALEMVHTIDKYYAQLFAYLVGRLDSFSEGDGKTVLDNTATVWFQEMSDGNSHNLNNMPILQAGSCGGYFKTGWAVNVEGGTADMTQGNSDGDCVNGQSPSSQARLRRNAGERCHEADQQVLLQPDERDRREGRGRRLPGQGRHRSRDEVRQVRRHEAVLGRRDQTGHDRQSRRVHGASRVIAPLARSTMKLSSLPVLVRTSALLVVLVGLGACAGDLPRTRVRVGARVSLAPVAARPAALAEPAGARASRPGLA